MTKFCPKCKSTKSTKLFSRDKQRPDGYAGHCRACKKEYRKNRDQKSYGRAWNLKRKYNLTVEQHAVMVEAQAARCASCGEKRSLVVDHCHKTGVVRALLCCQCNRALGFLYDSPAKILALHAYIVDHFIPGCV
jgi:hypothetical protein